MKRSKYDIQFHYSLSPGGPIKKDCFVCYGITVCDAVNLWLEHCFSKGYARFYMDSYIETPS